MLHRYVLAFIVSAAGLLGGASSYAFEYGENATTPIKIVVTTAPGGAHDRLARLMADRLGKKISKPVIVENRPGGVTRTAIEYVQSQPANGYTILQHSSVLTYLAEYFADPKLQPLKSLTPVAGLTNTSTYIMVNKNSPHRTLQELLKGMREKPDAYNWGVSYIGSYDHLMAIDLLQKAGVKTTFVGYKGEAPMVVDFMSNQIQVVMQLPTAYKAHFETGAVRQLAVTSANRDEDYPSVPTIAEQGFPGYSSQIWYGWFVRNGADPQVVQALSKAVEDIKKEPEFIAKVHEYGSSVYPGGREEFISEIQRNGKLLGGMVRKLDLKVN